MQRDAGRAKTTAERQAALRARRAAAGLVELRGVWVRQDTDVAELRDLVGWYAGDLDPSRVADQAERIAAQLWELRARLPDGVSDEDRQHLTDVQRWVAGLAQRLAAPAAPTALPWGRISPETRDVFEGGS